MLIHSCRPRQLQDVIGHSVVIKELKKRSLDKNFPQVMMFAGDTGTGKTTTGFIVASLLNCENPIDHKTHLEPCLTCRSCKSVISEKFDRSIKFYDGSSLNKEGVEGLKNMGMSMSMFEENTIIIIEEAQEINSPQAKNALLTLLEKPHKNVYFILLTMQLSKIPKAVRDRCSVYNLKELTTSQISDYLFTLLEEVDPEQKIPESFMDVLQLISKNCSGSLRKAVGDFERCFYGEIYDKKVALAELGYMDEVTSYNLLYKLLSKDPTFFDDLGKDIESFFNYTFAILCNIGVGKLNPLGLSDWQKQNDAKLIQTNNIDVLLTVYADSYSAMRGYFNKSVFYTNLLKYLKIERPRSRRHN